MLSHVLGVGCESGDRKGFVGRVVRYANKFLNGRGGLHVSSPSLNIYFIIHNLD